jgi:hypothetical protein
MDDGSLTDIRNLRAQLFGSATGGPSSPALGSPAESAQSVGGLWALGEGDSDVEAEEEVIPITFESDDITFHVEDTTADDDRLGDSEHRPSVSPHDTDAIPSDSGPEHLEEILREEMADVCNRKDGETTIALNLCIRVRRSRVNCSRPTFGPEIETIFQLALVPSSLYNHRFVSAFLQIKFMSPSGVRVIEFAPKDSQTSKTRVEHEHEVKASLTAAAADPHNLFNANSTLDARWLKKFSRVTTSHVTGAVTDSFSELGFSFCEDQRAEAGLDRHHELLFKLNKHGDIKARIYLRATLKRGWRKITYKLGEADCGKEFTFKLASSEDAVGNTEAN